jgi:hypothetical protein
MVDKSRLLQDKDVLGEINRHKWLQSEMAGHDIGFDEAADDWINKYSSAWLASRPKPKRK